jgi:hypothetical protein
MAGDPVTSAGDAAQLAAVHNTLHHRDHGTATVEPTHTADDASAGAAGGFLEPPRSDAELLMYCVLISDVLHSIADRIGDWTIGLGAAGIPASVIGPIEAAARTVHDRARAALYAGAALEHDLAHARSVAARGLVFTGHDAA